MIKFLNFVGFLHVKICEQSQRLADKTWLTDSIKYCIITQTHFIYTLQIQGCITFKINFELCKIKVDLTLLFLDL